MKPIENTTTWIAKRSGLRWEVFEGDVPVGLYERIPGSDGDSVTIGLKLYQLFAHRIHSARYSLEEVDPSTGALTCVGSATQVSGFPRLYHFFSITVEKTGYEFRSRVAFFSYPTYTLTLRDKVVGKVTSKSFGRAPMVVELPSSLPIEVRFFLFTLTIFPWTVRVRSSGSFFPSVPDAAAHHRLPKWK